MRSETSQGFFTAVQEIYRRQAAALTSDNWTLPRPEELADSEKERIESTGLFGPVKVQRYYWKATHDADSYIHLFGVCD